MGGLLLAEKAGLSKYRENSMASLKGFLNSKLYPFPILIGPEGFGGVECPLRTQVYSPASGEVRVSNARESPRLLGSNLILQFMSTPSTAVVPAASTVGLSTLKSGGPVPTSLSIFT